MRTICAAMIAMVSQAAFVVEENMLGATAGDMQGQYSDPNHPGCPRALIVFTETTGAMYGNDDCTGLSDPWGPLPTTIADDLSIVVDFSSKGGPSDLPGAYALADGAELGTITWSDGNVWTQTLH